MTEQCKILMTNLEGVLQEKEAREASLIREYEAEQLEELGEAARADFVKKEEASKETTTLINFVKGGSFVGRREERLREVEQVLQIPLELYFLLHMFQVCSGSFGF